MISRRLFLKLSVTSAGTFLIARFGVKEAFAIPVGPTLDPALLPKFVTPLLVPPVMPRAGTLVLPGGKPADYYEISMRQIAQQILPAGQPATTVWGYGAVRSASKKGLLIHNAPSLTIEAEWKRPVRVKWINELRLDPADPSSPFLPHLLPVDPTLHWANPPGGVAGRGLWAIVSLELWHREFADRGALPVSAGGRDGTV